MKNTTIKMLVCPTCGSTTLNLHVLKSCSVDRVETGFVYCDRQHWFPIEHEVLELLEPSLMYREDRTDFGRRYESVLRSLDLSPDDNLESCNACGRNETVSAVQAQQQHFDWYAKNDAQSYDEYSHMPFWEAVDGATFATWRQCVSDGDTVLDVGCAQGRASIQFAGRGPAVIGIDISKQLVVKAYENFRRCRYPGPFDFIVADATRLPFRDATFTRVLIYGVLHHLPHPDQTCQEAARVLRADGLFLSSENNESTFRWIFDLLMRWRKIWHEEAGAQPLLRSSDVMRWFSATGIQAKTRTIVFVPPHLVNMLPRSIGRGVLAVTDCVFGAIPFLRANGGLLLIEGRKAGFSETTSAKV